MPGPDPPSDPDDDNDDDDEDSLLARILPELLGPSRPLPPLFPDQTWRPDNQLSEAHQHPWRMFLDPSHVPSAGLYFPESILHDLKNGPVRLRNLPACVEVSNMRTNFVLIFLSLEDSPIRDISPRHQRINMHVIKHTLNSAEYMRDTNRHEAAITIQALDHTLRLCWSMGVMR